MLASTPATDSQQRSAAAVVGNVAPPTPAAPPPLDPSAAASPLPATPASTTPVRRSAARMKQAAAPTAATGATARSTASPPSSSGAVRTRAVVATAVVQTVARVTADAATASLPSGDAADNTAVTVASTKRRRGGGQSNNGNSSGSAKEPPKRARRAAAAAAAPAPDGDAAQAEDSEPGGAAAPAAAAAAAGSKPAKAPRVTKAMKQEAVRQDALRGVFPPHVTLHERYPHSASYGRGPVELSAEALAVAAEGNAKLPPQPAPLPAPQEASESAIAAAAAAVLHNAAGVAEFIAAASNNGGSGGDGGGGTGIGGRGGSAASSTTEAADEPKKTEAEEDAEEEDATPARGAGRAKRGAKGAAAPEAAGGSGRRAAKPKPLPPNPPLPAPVRPMPAIIPNLGYACLCATMREHNIFASRDTNKAGFQSKGLPYISGLALANAKDLRPLIEWNEAHGIRLFRLSSGIFPWMSFYRLEELPDAEAIKEALADAGAAAKRYGHRLTFHPSEFTKIASDKPEVVETSVKELEVHSLIFDLMGFLPASVYNKINIHVGGVYGDKVATMDRFANVVLERLSPNCRARLTVENDDRPSMFSVTDLMYLAGKAGIPIVFDFHHHRFCSGGISEQEALRLAISTWPPGVRPIVHWSESQEGRRLHAHSDYVSGPINLHGLERDVDVMIESKAKEMALLHYREAAINGRAADRPELPSDAAAVLGDE